MGMTINHLFSVIFFCHVLYCVMIYAAFTLYGFDDQERNLTFVKTDFQVLKLKFYAWNFKQAVYPLHTLYIACPLPRFHVPFWLNYIFVYLFYFCPSLCLG